MGASFDGHASGLCFVMFQHKVSPIILWWPGPEDVIYGACQIPEGRFPTSGEYGWMDMLWESTDLRPLARSLLGSRYDSHCLSTLNAVLTFWRKINSWVIYIGIIERPRRLPSLSIEPLNELAAKTRYRQLLYQTIKLLSQMWNGNGIFEGISPPLSYSAHLFCAFCLLLLGT